MHRLSSEMPVYDSVSPANSDIGVPQVTPARLRYQLEDSSSSDDNNGFFHHVDRGDVVFRRDGRDARANLPSQRDARASLPSQRPLAIQPTPAHAFFSSEQPQGGLTLQRLMLEDASGSDPTPRPHDRHFGEFTAEPMAMSPSEEMQRPQMSATPSLAFHVEIEFLVPLDRGLLLEPETERTGMMHSPDSLLALNPHPSLRASDAFSRLANNIPVKMARLLYSNRIPCVSSPDELDAQFNRRVKAQYGTDVWTVRNPVKPLEVRPKSTIDDEPFTGLAVCSPLFSEMSLSACTQSVQTLVRIVKQNYNVGVNASTRLRIDVKPDGDCPFDLAYLKRLVRFVWAASPLLDELHPPHCGPGSPVTPGLTSTKAFNAEGFRRLDQRRGQRIEVPDLFDAGAAVPVTVRLLETPTMPSGRASAWYVMRLLHVEQAETLQELVEKLAVVPGRENGMAVDAPPGAYRFETLLHEGTVQFAQHAGTMDSVAITQWVRVCLALVSICHPSRIEPFDRIVRRLIPARTSIHRQLLGINASVQDNKEMENPLTVYELLRQLGCHHAAAYYEKRGRHPQSPDVAHLGRQHAVKLGALLRNTPANPQYTFGVELEFFVPHGRDDKEEGSFVDPYPEDRRWFQKNAISSHEIVRKILTDGGFYSINDNHNQRDSTRYEHDRAKKGGFLLVRDIPPVYQAWCVKTDGSLMCGVVPGYSGEIGVEIAGPIGCANRQGYHDFVRGVCHIRNRIRTLIKNECGLHVHVSTHNGRWTYLTVKRVVSLCWFIEPVISALLPPTRFANPYFQPIHAKSDAACGDYTPPAPETERDGDLEAHVPMDILDGRVRAAMWRIWVTCTGLSELEDAISRIGSRGSLSVHRLRQRRDVDGRLTPIAGTVEFRHQDGCLDPERIVRWSRFCVAMVRVAEHAPAAEIRELLTALAPLQEDFKTWNRRTAMKFLPFVMRALGLPEEDVDFWWHRCRRFQPFDDMDQWMLHRKIISTYQVGEEGRPVLVYQDFVPPVSEEESGRIGALVRSIPE